MKYMSVLGDSISSFIGTIPVNNRVYYDGFKAGVSNKEQMWWYIVAQSMNYQPLVIEGSSGTSVCHNIVPEYKIPASEESRCLHLHDQYDPDVILIAMSTNDYIFNAPIKQFYHEYESMIQKIIKRYNKAKIVLFSPWYIEHGDTNALGLTENDYYQVIQKIASVYHLDTINLLSIYQNLIYYPEYCNDGPEHHVHPNVKGQAKNADYIITQLKKIME